MCLVSVVIPVYNADAYIKKTIESVQLQTIKDIEILVIDDCSTDDSVNICLELASTDLRIKVFKSALNFGCPGGPRNIGVANSSGKWVAFLDADDIWHRQKLEVQLAVLKASNLQFCSSLLKKFKVDSDYSTTNEVTSSDFKIVSYMSQMFNYQTPTSSVILERSLAQSEPFREEIEFKAREDIDCWLRIHRRIRCSAKVTVNLIGYRIVENQISGNKLSMIGRTYYCYVHTTALKKSFLNLLPLLLTCTHLLRGFYKKLLSNSI
tara:strand:+ start:10474 stop:11268 length:795 start_codon:yes stop_codon:yes gene_type:complete